MTITNLERFNEAMAGFDAANREDPNTEDVDGVSYPKELLYAQRMTEWLNKFAPNAPEVVQLAARSQHIRRWVVPRDSYSMDKVGYKRWRTGLYKFHGDTAGEIMAAVGYDEATIERVKTLLQKKQLKQDPDVQLLEDVICLVFLDYYFADFAKKHDEEKLIGIIRKTWRKMSDKGHEAARQIDYPAELRPLLEKALAS